MKFEIEHDEVEPETIPVRLGLRYEGNDVDVVALDREGSILSCLVSFRESGKLFKYAGISVDLGFKRNKNGQIVVQ